MPCNIIGYSIMLNFLLTIYGAKLYMVFLSGFQLNLFNSGIASMGGVIGMLCAIVIMGFIYREGRRDLWEAYTLVIPLLYSISKIGCHIAGCCHGIPYEGILAVSYNNEATVGGPYFPVQMMETIVFFLLFLVSLVLYCRKSKYLSSAVFILCAMAKFSLEFLREEHIGKLVSANQIFCIGFVILGILIGVIQNRIGQLSLSAIVRQENRKENKIK